MSFFGKSGGRGFVRPLTIFTRPLLSYAAVLSANGNTGVGDTAKGDRGGGGRGRKGTCLSTGSGQGK
jgi:hypothetical protein